MAHKNIFIVDANINGIITKHRADPSGSYDIAALTISMIDKYCPGESGVGAICDAMAYNDYMIANGKDRTDVVVIAKSEVATQEIIPPFGVAEASIPGTQPVVAIG